MDFTQFCQETVQRIIADDFISATISQPRTKSSDLRRVRLKRVEIKQTLYIQFEYQYERELKHENIGLGEVERVLPQILEDFRQVQAQFASSSVHVKISKKFKVIWNEKQEEVKRVANVSHNRQKQYILDEDTVHPFLVRLGVQSEEGKIRAKYYHKFRQINRFLEMIDDALVHLPKDKDICILDFGSGKSYLTFALYHYLHIMKGLNIRVTGLDLKKEVIEHCQEIADDLGYDRLEFLVGDINEYNEESAVDMVVTLHACDVATDMALARAVRWGASVILSVPCCQHELFRQVDAPELDVMLQHGLVKERFSALATDAIRAELLGLVGYDVQLLEFIDMEHTPKNILIRAYKADKKVDDAMVAKYTAFRNLLGAKPFLENELKDRLELGE